MANISFMAPQQSPTKSSINRKMEMAKMLMDAGKQDGKTEMVSGLAVPQSPWLALGKGIAGGIGTYQQGEALRKEEMRDKNKNTALSEAMDAYSRATSGGQTDLQSGDTITWDKQSPNTAGKLYANMLAQNEDTAPLGMQSLMSQMQDAQRAETDLETYKAKIPYEMDMLRQKAELQARYPRGSTPAPVQILQEVEKRIKAGDIQGANMLMQISKVYDKGINPFSPQENPQGVGLPTSAPQPNAAPMPQAPAMTFQPIQGYGQSVGSIEQTKENMKTTGKNQSDLTYGPQIKKAEAAAGEVGKRLGEAEGSLKFLEANMPKLRKVTQELSNLGKTATYTMAGRGVDVIKKEFGANPRQGAVDRTAYIAKVDNEILPLLRDTFGSAFTVKEGDSLRATLGDPNKTPEEKDAVLNAFISQKEEQVRSLGRQVGREPMQTPNTPVPSGQIAVNPQTGERMINRGNGWEVLK